MTDKIRSWLGGGDRKQHNPVVCLLCGLPVRNKLRQLPCLHVYCVPCWEDYTCIPSLLTDGWRPTWGSDGPYCPTCLKPCAGTESKSKLPPDVKALISAVKKRQCGRHGNRDIVTTCAVCNAACCSACVGNEHQGHDVFDDISSEDWVSVWQLNELVDRVCERETLAAQALKLQREHDDALARIKAAVQSYTAHQMAALKHQEARILAQLEAQHSTVTKQIELLHRLATKTAEATKLHICYLHGLLSSQPKRREELLVNQAALIARTRTLLLNTPPDDKHLTESICMQHCTRFFRFHPAAEATLGTLSETHGVLPAVSRVQHTLNSILDKDDPGTNKTPLHIGNGLLTPGTSYRIREKPEMLAEIYAPCSDNVEPGNALFLPDDRLVVAERKGHKISIWNTNYQTPDQNIVSRDEIFPYAMTYWAKEDSLIYTDFRHRTVGLVKPTGEDMRSLESEIVRFGDGIGVLNSDYIVVSDNNRIEVKKRGVKVVNPYTSQIVRIYHDGGSPGWISVLRDQRVAVTDKDANAVFLYDQHGNRIARIAVNAPEGVTEDRRGDLLIASGGSPSPAVQLYDGRELRPRGQEVLSPRNGGLQSPAALALGHNGQLAVVQRTGTVRIYALYDCG